MNQIIDVDYEVVESMENKSVEELAVEANQFYAQAEAVANVALMYMAQAGAKDASKIKDAFAVAESLLK